MENNIIGSIVRVDNDRKAIVIDEIGYQCILLFKDGLKEIWDRIYIYEILTNCDDLLKGDYE